SAQEAEAGGPRPAWDKPLCGMAEHLAELDAAEGAEYQEDPQDKPKIPHPIDNEGLLAGIGRRLPGEPEADQEVGAQPHPFPSQEHQQEIVPHDQEKHGEDEQIQIGKITLEALLAMHIADGIDMDE